MLDRELEVAIAVAREAGAILMEIYATDFAVAYKQPADPVTEADARANEHIVRRLREAFPGDGIVAEETPDRRDGISGKGRCWYVDPLDGTKEFIKKNGEFSVMIGLAVDGSAELGVVYRPVGDKLYAGVVGSGARVEHEGDVRTLYVSDRAEPSSLRFVVSRSHRSAETDAFIETLGITEERASGSVGLKVGIIAERDADLYAHISSKSSAWDACAPDAILRAAGGSFTDLAGDRFFYGGESVANSRGILACGQAAFPHVLEAARAAGRAAGLLL